MNLNSGQDLVHLGQLDQKLWTALSCPVHGLEIDFKTLELIDVDNDDRIRVPEVLDAVNWLVSLIKNPDDILGDNPSLPLAAINDETEEGRKIIASAKQILVNLGNAGATHISVNESSDLEKIFANTKFNGDSVITEASADEDSLKNLIKNICDCIGSIPDRSGDAGVTADHINEFYTACAEYSLWSKYAEENSAAVLPFGDATAGAFASYTEVKAKIDDYFLRGQLAGFDPTSVDALNLLAAHYESFIAKDLSVCAADIAVLPIAKVEGRKALPLNEGINPCWEQALLKFKKLVLVPMFSNKSTLSSEEWLTVIEKFGPYSNWMLEKKGIHVEMLGLAKVRELLNASEQDKLLALVDLDMAVEQEANAIFMVDKLVRFYRDIFTLLKNFVNFSDFYSPHSKAIFQIGHLYIDQRCCDLCIKVSDMPKHGSMAGSSGICLIYCDCSSKKNNEKMTIVAAFTDGDFDEIVIGRNALFYDRDGGDWDATIIKIIDNPISIRQAFWSPYKKFANFISGQISKIATAKESEVHTVTTSHVEKTGSKIDSGLTGVVKSDAPPAEQPKQPPVSFDIGKFVGIFAALSMALGAIGSIIAVILTSFFKLVWWKMPLALLGIILAISLPSMVLAFMKLRKRNLAPVLDANGWAINARLTINILFGNTLTHLAKLPANSKFSLLEDPFSKKSDPVITVVTIVFILLCILAFLSWYFGWVKHLLH